MEICPEEPRPRPKLPSIIEIKNKIKLGHDECCNCCCCKPPQFPAYKYLQPEIPKSFRPIRRYNKLDVPLENNTTYKLSFWPGPRTVTKPIIPEGCLTVADGPIQDETTHKMSYLGNWCVKKQEKILPCARNWFGRGPLQDKTTQKYDFTWKSGAKEQPIVKKGQLCIPRGHVADDTTYKLSFYQSDCLEPIKSFKPVRKYEKCGIPLEGYTTYNLSYHEEKRLPHENYPWKEKPKYIQPTTPLEGSTTYKLSYWPSPCAERVKPITQQADENLLNKGCCFDENTTYNLSFDGCGGNRPESIRPSPNKLFEDCPLDHDTVNKMSYLGNWCPKPVKPIIPCTRQFLGRGPVEDNTTHKMSYLWQCGTPNQPIRPVGNLTFSPAPLECCTTNKLSFMPACDECYIPNKSFAPVRKYVPTDLPMDCVTVAHASYKPLKAGPKEEKPWAMKPKYHKPTTSLEDNTTYGLSFYPPGKIVPCCPEPCYEESACPSTNSQGYPAERDNCFTSAQHQVTVQKDTRPCISC